MEAILKTGGRPAHAPAFLKERKFLMIIPLLILPFLTMAFWALGGGKGNDPISGSVRPAAGINTDLPQARFGADSSRDKMGIYQASLKDSTSEARNDLSDGAMGSMAFNGTEDALGAGSNDSTEAKIRARLAQISTQLSRPEPAVSTSAYTTDGGNSAENERLRRMMSKISRNSEAEDPEMKQLSHMLQQISDIQNPENTGSAKERSLKNRRKVYAVAAAADETEDAPTESEAGNAIQAVIHEDQTLVSGAVVKLRLVDGVYVKGRMIPKGSFVYGVSVLNGERLEIKISSVRYLNNILPVALSVYDLDGLEGLYVPGSISRDAAKDGLNNAVGSVQLMSMGHSLGTQAAGAGIEAAKGLFGKKVKQIKVKVKAGYEVLLRDMNDKEN